ncbi:MAG: HU family DNA-binding protein, partial [Bacteroidales bacterium]|nr:HU family DNA-binding protein [Bacteroidales bacterium]MBR3945864.1 HU family DNA-binding protein [Bacteroidales bacterium]
MTKADIVNAISENTGIEKMVVQKTVEAFMESVKGSLIKGEDVFLRGFGSFIVKTRAEKTARDMA